MIIGPEDLRAMSDDQIYESMLSGTFNSDHYNHCVTILNLRFSQRLSLFTRRLVLATWALAFVSLALVVSTIIALFGKT